MIVGMSLTSGILLESASTKTVFRPPTCAHGNQEDEVHVKGKDYNHSFPMSRANSKPLQKTMNHHCDYEGNADI
jgi:hypothetical protein